MSELTSQQRRDLTTAESAARYLGDAFMEIFDSPETLEIYVNPDGRVWADRIGEGSVKTDLVLQPERTTQFLNVVAAYLGETLTHVHPAFGGAMPRTRFHGSRIQGYIPPRSRIGPGFNLRKHATRVFPLESYVERGALSWTMFDLLIQAIDNRMNILVAGGTSSGKTTFLNAIMAKAVERFPSHRFILIEDTPELQCTAEDQVPLTTLVGESMGVVVRETMRLKPVRPWCGEFRDSAAYHCCDLWSTGHPGGGATTHANDALGALERVNRLALDGKEGSYKWLVADAIQVVAIIQKTPVGGKVSDLAFVNGLNGDRFLLEHAAA